MGPRCTASLRGAHPEKGSYAFTYGVSTGDLIAVNLRYFHDRGWKKIGLITSTDASGQDGETGVDAALARPAFKDMTLVAREHYGVSDQDGGGPNLAHQASGAQAILAWGTGQYRSGRCCAASPKSDWTSRSAYRPRI